MGTDVIATETDHEIARIGITLQAKAHNVQMTDEVKAFLEHMIKFNAGHFATERHIQNALHALTFGNKENQLKREVEAEKKKVAALEKQVKELQSHFGQHSEFMLNTIEMEQICLNP